MDDQRKPEELENFEVTELDDQALDDVAGGGNTNCGCVNSPCSDPSLDTVAT